MTDDDVIEPAVIRLRPGAEGWRKVDGPELDPEDPFLTGLDEATAEDWIRSNHALQHATVREAQAYYHNTPPFDPSEFTVPELEEQLREGDYSDVELEVLAEVEAEGQERRTALAKIDEAHSSGYAAPAEARPRGR